MRWSVLLLLVPGVCAAQDRSITKVIDARTREPLPFCSVVLQHQGSGTLTNDDGVFGLPVDAGSDSVIFSMVGYTRTIIALTDVIHMRVVELEPYTTELATVEVRSKSAELYTLVARCAKRLRRTRTSTAKVYFEMGTHMDDRPVEVIECFYNGRINGPHIASLELKHGRIGIAPAGDRFFVSLNVTKAMSLLDIRMPHDQFPADPFQWTSARAIAKRYRVAATTHGTDGSALVHVRLTPRDSSGNFFSAEAWIDATTGMPRSIILACDGCTDHPFQPIAPSDRIHAIDMQVRLTMTESSAEPELHHMELRYKMDYEDTTTRHSVLTEAVMHVFDRGRPFLLPVFTYDDHQYDYRKITFQPYDSSFWATAPTLVRTERQERDLKFFAEHGHLTSSTRLPEMKGNAFFESNYARWAPDRRISLRTLPPPPGEAVPAGNAGRVHLEAQLYLDVDTGGSRPRIFTATVFDAFRSYYRAPEVRQTDAFLNIFFDLCEIERRRMDAQLRMPGQCYEDMLTIHAAARRNVERITREYLLDTDNGTNVPAMSVWNQRVKDALGIDNFALIGLDADQR